jgi:putative MATE family efflux protein
MKSYDNLQFIKRVLLISVPIIIQQIINLSVNLCNGIMVGQLQEAAISGVSIGNQFYILFQIFCMGLGGGAAVMVNQLWAKKDVQSVMKVITLMLRICVVVALCFTLLSLFATDFIINIFTNHTDILVEGRKYLWVMAFAFIIHGVGLTLTIVYRSVGVVWLALISSLLSFGLNIFLNWVFIFGNLGCKPMGVSGSALGTVIARFVEFAVIVTYVFFIDKKIVYRVKMIFMSCNSVIKRFKGFALPVIISDVMLQLGNSILTIIMGHMKSNETMLAANNISTITVQISTFFILGLSNAASIIIGTSIGEGKIEEAKLNGKRFLYISIGVGLVASILIELLSPIIIGAYKVSDVTIDCAKNLISAVSVIMVFQSVSSVLTKGVLRGGGDTKFLMVADVLFLWIAAVPLGYLCGIVLNLSSFWVYFMMKIDMIIKAVWCTYRLYQGNWIKKVHT